MLDNVWNSARASEHSVGLYDTCGTARSLHGRSVACALVYDYYFDAVLETFVWDLLLDICMQTKVNRAYRAVRKAGLGRHRINVNLETSPALHLSNMNA